MKEGKENEFKREHVDTSRREELTGLVDLRLGVQHQEERHISSRRVAHIPVQQQLVTSHVGVRGHGELADDGGHPEDQLSSCALHRVLLNSHKPSPRTDATATTVAQCEQQLPLRSHCEVSGHIILQVCSGESTGSSGAQLGDQQGQGGHCGHGPLGSVFPHKNLKANNINKSL